MVPYRNQWPVHFILHFTELQISNSIKYENTLFKKYFLKSYIVKRNFISFNCFSEYMMSVIESIQMTLHLFQVLLTCHRNTCNILERQFRTKHSGSLKM